MHFLNLTLGIRLKEMALYYSMKMVCSNENKNKIIYSNSMKTNRNELIRRLLSGVTDDELENLVRVREEARRPIPAPRKMGVKQLIRFFENNNLYKPPRPTPAPRTKKEQPQPQPRPIPAPRTKIMEKSKALKGYTKLYENHYKKQLQKTRLAISRFFEKILNQNKGFKFVETIVVYFEKLKNGEPEEEMVYFNSKAQIIMNISDIKPNLEMSQEKIMNDVAEWLKEGSGWTTDGVLENYFNLVNYKPLEGKSYIPLPKELQNSLKCYYDQIWEFVFDYIFRKCM